jgi:chromosome partitioning protein
MSEKVITIAQQKGGAGKTTVAAHLAVAWSQRGKRVAIIDIDPQGSLTQWHKLRERRFGEGYTGLTFAALSGWRVGSEVARLRRNHDIIIIDSPPHTETEARTAIRNADLILVPVQPSPTDLWATKATLDLAKAENIPVRVILNRVTSNSKLAQAIADELPDLAKTTLGNRVLFASSFLEGRSVTELAPGSPAAIEIKMLSEELGRLLKTLDKPVEEASDLGRAVIKQIEMA